MNYSLFIIFLLIGVSQSFLEPVNQVIDNADDSINSATNRLTNSILPLTNLMMQQIDKLLGNLRDHFDNVLRGLLNSANQSTPSSDAIWDNLFSPVFDMLTSGAETFFSDKFALINQILGRPLQIQDNILSEKYFQLVARLKSNIHHLYEILFLMQKDALAALANGDQNFNERIRAFIEKFLASRQQLEEWANQTKKDLESYASTLEGDKNQILQQYKQNLDVCVKTINVLFEHLTQHLIKTLI